MERITLEALPRETSSKGDNKQLRRKGLIPAVLYGRGIKPQKIVLNGSTFKKALGKGGNVIIDLKIKGENGSSQETVIVKELQRHPVQQDFILHADLMRISMKEKLEVKVPLNFTGESRGVKEGGIFQVQLREVSVRCLPTDIPEYIDVPVDDLNIGEVITVADLKLPEGVEMLEEENEILATILVPEAEKIEDEEAAEEDGQEEKGSIEQEQ